MRKYIGRTLGAAALLTCLAAPAYAQKLNQEVMVSSNPNERVVSRTTGFYERGGYKLFGMFDTPVKADPDYFLLLAGHRELAKGIDLVVEGTKSRGSQADIGLGFGYDIRMPKGAYLNPHVLPFNFERSGMARRSEFEVLGGFRGDSYYMDGMMKLSFPYNKRRECNGELSVGKKLGKRFAAQASFAHNSRGNAVRADLKYGAYGK